MHWIRFTEPAKEPTSVGTVGPSMSWSRRFCLTLTQASHWAFLVNPVLIDGLDVVLWRLQGSQIRTCMAVLAAVWAPRSCQEKVMRVMRVSLEMKCDQVWCESLENCCGKTISHHPLVFSYHALFIPDLKTQLFGEKKNNHKMHTILSHLLTLEYCTGATKLILTNGRYYRSILYEFNRFLLRRFQK